MCKPNNQIVVQVPKNIKIYYNDPTVRNPKENISIDSCLVDEIKDLWSKDIRTCGCCCGHEGLFDSFINIHPKDIKKTLELGYKLYEFKKDPNRKDTVVPKTILGAI